MELFTPVITTTIICLMFLIYLNIFYDVSCQRLFEKENFETLTDDDDDGDYNLELK